MTSIWKQGEGKNHAKPEFWGKKCIMFRLENAWDQCIKIEFAGVDKY
jgi:hypothetical protein